MNTRQQIEELIKKYKNEIDIAEAIDSKASRIRINTLESVVYDLKQLLNT